MEFRFEKAFQKTSLNIREKYRHKKVSLTLVLLVFDVFKGNKSNLETCPLKIYCTVISGKHGQRDLLLTRSTENVLMLFEEKIYISIQANTFKGFDMER